MFLLLFSLAYGWNYNFKGSDWGGLCTDGVSQSPINLQKTKTSLLDSLYSMQVYYYGQTKSRTVQNNGNYIFIEDYFGYITIQDSKGKNRQFLSTKIEFHIPSEHYIGDYPTHMEMEIFHTVADGDYTFDFPSIAVVSVMLRPGTESYFFNSIGVSNLPATGNLNVLAANSNINLLSIVSPDDNYFFYNGSLTQPDCEENVLRYVFETQQYISFIQIGYFQSLFMPGVSDTFSGGGNSRSIKSLNSRTVYYSSSYLIFPVIGFLLS